MVFDFDEIVDRKGSDCYKWDKRPEALPMWVADMDFRCAPAIVDALQKRVDHGVFGYSFIPKRWSEAYRTWWGERHGLEIDSQWLIFCTGVIPAISSVVRKLTTPGENVVVQSPVYNVFYNSIKNNGRNVLENELVLENGAYHIDFDDLENKLADPQTTLMLLCNPQNPSGTIWDEATLARIGEMAQRNHVVVVSDEIHCDVCDPGSAYVPFARVSETCARNSVTCLAPTKSFNIAGIKTAAVMVVDDNLRHKVWRALNTDEVAEANSFAIDAACAAFGESGEWLDQMCAYVAENKRLACEFIAREVPQVSAISGPATYLLWLDCRQVTNDSDAFGEYLIEHAGLWLNSGNAYGKGGQGFMRMNLACPRSTLEEGLRRFAEGVRVSGGRFF